MATLREKRDPIKLFFRRVGLFAIVIFVCLAAVGDWRVYRKESESRALRTEAELRARDLEQQAAVLRADLSRLQTDRGKEETLRDEYNMGKDGEELIVIVDASGSVPVEATSTLFQKLRKALPWW